MMGLGREAALRQGITLEAVTVGYNALEGLVAIAAGIAAASVALTGFGIDSVIEVTSGALLWWRLRAELGLAPLGPTVERRAARGAGFLLLALGLYIVTDSVRVLVTGSRASRCGQPWEPGPAGGCARDHRLRLALRDDASRSRLERGPRLVVGRPRRCVRDAAADRARGTGGIARGGWRKRGHLTSYKGTLGVDLIPADLRRELGAENPLPVRLGVQSPRPLWC